jgi:hypothetical protein
MNLDDFIKNADELGVIALETDQLKEVTGGIGAPVAEQASWKQDAAILYYVYGEGCYSC